MKLLAHIILLIVMMNCSGNSQVILQEQKNDTIMKYRTLNEFEQYVILNKGTERPFSGEYTDLFEKGRICCNNVGRLYTSQHKFILGVEWPAFDMNTRSCFKSSRWRWEKVPK
jgi:hypothetical protein